MDYRSGCRYIKLIFCISNSERFFEINKMFQNNFAHLQQGHVYVLVYSFLCCTCVFFFVCFRDMCLRVQCVQSLWIVHSLFLLWFSLKFIFIDFFAILLFATLTQIYSLFKIPFNHAVLQTHGIDRRINYNCFTVQKYLFVNKKTLVTPVNEILLREL